MVFSQRVYQYSRTIGSYAMGGRGFLNPSDMALGNDQRLYVINRADMDYGDNMPYKKRVTICTLDEEYLGQFSSGGTEDGQMMWAVSIAIDKGGLIYISDEALQRISIFDKEGQFLGKWGVRGTKDGEFDRPAGITFDREDNLLVVDSRNNRIQRYSRDGRYLGGWGKPGKGEGEFNLPWGICTDASGNVYVSDWRNDRIQKFDPDGKHVVTLGISGAGAGEFRRPSWVAVDQDGDIAVTDWGNERVQILGPDGAFRVEYRGNAELSKWGAEYFVANPDEAAERAKADLEPPVDLYPTDQLRDRSAAVEKLFWGPVSVKMDDQGRMYVVESCRHRIQVYQKA